ncbi:MAG: DUF4351 domain-containing protein [Magnetococcales bacterium]|nr:DUF4351 domain-containing protein [Magnetococcales bacterium]MBF0322867.1 DUF4351 domain-containing protein [Magnetococcales bacterium]
MGDHATKTCWHCLVGETLRTLLEPAGIEVRSEVPVVSLPPKADLILIRRKEGGWTNEQRLLLADGLRDLYADQILAELKITENLNEDALCQITVYDTLYLETAHLERHQLRSVIISSTTPQKGFLERFAFEPVGPGGVYESKPRWGGAVRLVLLNELADEARNAPLKCFASRQDERKKAFETVKRAGLFRLSVSFGRIIVGLWRLLMKSSLNSPEMEGMTPEYVSQLGKEWLDWLVEVTPEEELASLPKLGHLLVREHQEGRQEEAATLFLLLLEGKFGELSSSIRERVSATERPTLEKWSLRLLKANSMEDVFGA